MAISNCHVFCCFITISIFLFVSLALYTNSTGHMHAAVGIDLCRKYMCVNYFYSGSVNFESSLIVSWIHTSLIALSCYAFKSSVAFGIARNFGSGLVLITIMWHRGECFRHLKSRGKYLGERNVWREHPCLTGLGEFLSPCYYQFLDEAVIITIPTPRN